MEVKNCRECGRLFNYIGGQRLCPACREVLEDKFTKVKKYIEEHKGAQIQEISDENEVSVLQIKQWIREERLAFTDDSIVGVECELCGAIIKTGRYCESCKKNMAATFNSVLNKKPQVELKKNARERARMRFLDNE